MKMVVTLALNNEYPDEATANVTVVCPNLSFDYYKIKELKVVQN